MSLEDVFNSVARKARTERGAAVQLEGAFVDTARLVGGATAAVTSIVSHSEYERFSAQDGYNTAQANRYNRAATVTGVQLEQAQQYAGQAGPGGRMAGGQDVVSAFAVAVTNATLYPTPENKAYAVEVASHLPRTPSGEFALPPGVAINTGVPIPGRNAPFEARFDRGDHAPTPQALVDEVSRGFAAALNNASHGKAHAQPLNTQAEVTFDAQGHAVPRAPVGPTSYMPVTPAAAVPIAETTAQPVSVATTGAVASGTVKTTNIPTNTPAESTPPLAAPQVTPQVAVNTPAGQDHPIHGKPVPPKPPVETHQDHHLAANEKAKGYNGVVPPETLKQDQVKEIQALLGVEADGKWGPKTEARFKEAVAAAGLKPEMVAFNVNNEVLANFTKSAHTVAAAHQAETQHVAAAHPAKPPVHVALEPVAITGHRDTQVVLPAVSFSTAAIDPLLAGSSTLSGQSFASGMSGVAPFMTSTSSVQVTGGHEQARHNTPLEVSPAVALVHGGTAAASVEAATYRATTAPSTAVTPPADLALAQPQPSQSFQSMSGNASPLFGAASFGGFGAAAEPAPTFKSVTEQNPLMQFALEQAKSQGLSSTITGGQHHGDVQVSLAGSQQRTNETGRA